MDKKFTIIDAKIVTEIIKDPITKVKNTKIL